MIYGITLILLALLSPAAPPRTGETCNPAFIPLFTPRPPAAGHYEVCTTDSPATDSRVHLAEPERLEPLDAFGTAGSYNRARLVQLYRGRRVNVVRGWRADDGQFESITLLSPYPDPTLSRLEPGTMIIRWTTDRR